MASINYNRLRTEFFNDRYAMAILDGMKVVVCKLKPNDLNITSIALPVDENRVPSWFQELYFDTDEMENMVIDRKIENLIGILKLDLSQSKMKTRVDSLFDFSE